MIAGIAGSGNRRPIVGGPSLNSQFAHVLEEIDMQGEVELLAPKDCSRLIYRNADGELLSHVGSAVPDPERTGAALQMLGLKGEEVYIGARLVAVADSYDTMVSGRRYRQPRTSGEALAELEAETGSRYDPNVVKLFAQLITQMAKNDNLG